MRLRAGVCLLLIVASLGGGCRKALAPNVDRNKPPETWITAAPLDTLGGRGIPAQPGTIPFLFHLYWAGSDPDGEVVGFFYAVTETTAVPAPGEGIPALPGPKPQDYRFTTKTDSSFIFTVVEGKPDRQHGFFIYAVDNEGKPDASPARFVFNSLDKAPPIPLVTRAEALGRIFTIGQGGQVSEVPFRRGPSWQPGMAGGPDMLADANVITTLPRDTIPSGAGVYFEWVGLPQTFGTYIAYYRYKLTEVDFVKVPPESTSKSYAQGTIPAGTQVLTLRAVDQAGGSTDSTRRFVVNFSPDTWFSGPDFSCIQSNPSWRYDAVRDFYYCPTPGANPSTSQLPSFEVPCSYLGPSTPAAAGNPVNWVNTLYADRPERRTFLEWWQDTLYARRECDTVHKNSIVFFISGGLDFDSPHVPLASGAPEAIPQGPNTLRGPANGSPIGFSGKIIVAEDPGLTSKARPTESLVYPDFRLGTPFYNPVPTLRELARFSGYAFCRVRAADGDGAKDDRVRDPDRLVETVDDPARCGQAIGGTPYERNVLRTKVLTFYINKPPVFSRITSPLPNQTIAAPNVHIDALGDDEDPANIGELTPPGIKGTLKVLRFFVTLHGDSAGVPVSRPDRNGPRLTQAASYDVDIPASWSPGRVDVEIQLCDCQDCETSPGQGRCITRTIPINWQPPSTSRPGLAPNASRGK